MQFLNPALLAGAALFAVPLIIHLLNRQRHKRRPWAAMDFLLKAYQRTRNRLRNENLLLLLLRCLVPILLALAIARPVMQSASALLGADQSEHYVVVVDSSYSMGHQRSGGVTAFERARSLTSRLLEKLAAKTEQNNRVTIVLAGVRPRFLVRNEGNIALARSQWLEITHPDDAATDLTDALSQVAEALEESNDLAAQVFVLTDLQTRAFGKALISEENEDDQQPEFEDTLRDVIDSLQQREGTLVHLIDVGPFAEQRMGGTAQNVQIADLRLDQPVAVARLPVNAVATIRNRGDATVSTQVTLEVDGAEPMRQVVEIEPSAEVEVEFQLTLREVGYRQLRVQLQNDALLADDSWNRVIEVRDRIRVLVVDGAADADPLKNYEFFYRAILDPASLVSLGDPNSPDALESAELARFQVETCDTLALLSGQQNPGDYDLTVLADVDRLNERAASALIQSMQAGNGLLVTFGKNADLDSYNLQLSSAGDGPMPFRLTRQLGSKIGDGVPRSVVIAQSEHPLLREYDEDIYREILQAVPVYQWLGCTMDSEREDAETILKLTDRDQSPLLVTAGFGDGRAVFLTSAPASELDPDRWNRLDDRYVVYQLIHGIAQWLALPLQDPFNVAVGTALTCSLPARPSDVEVLVSDRAGGRKYPLSEDPMPLEGGRYAMPPYTNTTMAGFYICQLNLEYDTGREPWSRAFAVNIDPEEGLLRYAPHDLVRESLSIERVLTALPDEAQGTAQAGGSEFGPTLLLIVLLLVVGEAAMARYVSVRRS